MAAHIIEAGRKMTMADRLQARSKVRWQDRLSEAFWFTVCLGLFMILGPFAAPIALAFVFTEQVVGGAIAEPDPVID